MDLARCRSDFPILTRSAHGHPLVYLDSAATSQKPLSVLAAEDAFYRTQNANVHRGAYELSEEATAAYEGARARVAKFLHADDPDEIVFVRGTTEAINLVAHGLGRGYSHGATGSSPRSSNTTPTSSPGTSCGARWASELEFVDIDDNGRLRMDDLEAKLAKPTKVVTLTHVSNVLGTVNPVRAIADRAHAAGALVVVDAAQSVPHRRVDVHELGADFVAFSGHKALGPTGIGVLWGRKELLDRLPPYMGGGEMIREVHTDRVTYRDPPGRFEAGTPNVAGAIGLAAALDYLENVGWESLATRTSGPSRTARCTTAHERFGDQVRFLRSPPRPGPRGGPLVLRRGGPPARCREHPRRRGGRDPCARATTAPSRSWSGSGFRRSPAPAPTSTTRSPRSTRSSARSARSWKCSPRARSVLSRNRPTIGPPCETG